MLLKASYWKIREYITNICKGITITFSFLATEFCLAFACSKQGGGKGNPNGP